MGNDAISGRIPNVTARAMSADLAELFVTRTLCFSHFPSPLKMSFWDQFDDEEAWQEEEDYGEGAADEGLYLPDLSDPFEDALPPPPKKSLGMGKSKGGRQLRRWAFTVWERPDLPLNDANLEIFKALLKKTCKKWCFQLEVGLTGRPHWQGRFSGSPMRETEAHHRFGASWKMHVSIEHDEEASGFYVMKEEGRVKGPWSDKDGGNLYVPARIRTMTYNMYQTRIEQMLALQDNRKILFVLDNGNTGKSDFMLHQSLVKDGLMVPSTTKSAQDMIQFVFSLLEGRNPGKTYTFFIEIPRASEDHWGPWCTALESLKNGVLYDTRYKGRQMVIEPPRVCVFANVKPHLSFLTADRWTFMSPTAAEIAEGPAPPSLSSVPTEIDNSEEL